MIYLLLIYWLIISARSFQLYVGDLCVDEVVQAAGECMPIEACPSAQTYLRFKIEPVKCIGAAFPYVVCCRYEFPKNKKPDKTTGYIEPFVNWLFNPLKLEQDLKFDIDYDQYFSVAEKISEKKCEEWYPGQISKSQDNNQQEYSHMAALGWFLLDGSVTFKCAGTLISERFVLTAAHCMDDLLDVTLVAPEPAFVRLGVDYINGNEPFSIPIDVPIAEIIKHPEFRPPTKNYDIALARMSKILPDTNYLKPACLWTSHEVDVSDGTFLTGWGMKMKRMVFSGLRKHKTRKMNKRKSALLKKAEVEMLDTVTCQQLLYYMHNQRWVGLQGHQLCAGIMRGSQRSAACQGDPGGPLQVSARKSSTTVYWVIGVTSRDQCGLECKPGVFTRVSAFVPWIESIVWPSD